MCSRCNAASFQVLPIVCFVLCLWGFGEKLPLTVPFEANGVDYESKIPKPDAVLGYTIGNRHTLPNQIVSYFREVAKASDRVIVENHGRTYEGRPLIHAVISSPQNMERIEQLRKENLKLSEKPAEVTGASLRDMPVIVFMGYSVHGNEASGSEAAMLTLYHLAAGKGEPVESVLSSAIVIIDPMLNPDGRSRFVSWVNWNRGRIATDDPADREHNEPWPGGRTNHYLFDLNRDWLPAQLKESKGRLELFHRWRPQLLTDFHEMGSNSTFFFQPGVPSRSNPNTPPRTQQLTAEIAQFHARELDRIGSLYYSKETFDDFYYGKGSTYPDINGAVGILFEQASSRGLVRKVHSGVLNFGFTIRNQIAASLSTLKAAVSLREKLLKNQRDFYREATEVATRQPAKGYLFQDKGDGTRARAMIEILLRHRIRVYRISDTVSVGGLEFERGKAYLIPTRQPQVRLIKTLVETVTSFSDPVFYDVSTWTIPLALDLQWSELRSGVAGHLGAEITQIEKVTGRIEGGQASYAYFMNWGYFAPRAIVRLQSAKLRLRLVTKPIEVMVDRNKIAIAPPGLLIPVVQTAVSPEKVHELVNALAEEEGMTFTALSTGLSLSGPDLGSPSLPELPVLRIALASGAGTRSYQVGEVWFVLNERMGVPISLVDLDRLKTELDRYNVLILVSGEYRTLKEEFVGGLRDWIRDGGLLIAVQGGARWAVEHKLVDEQLRTVEKEERGLSYEEARERVRSQRIGGSIFEAEIDTSHPLAMGFGEKLAFFRSHDTFFEPSKVPGANVALYTKAPLLSGYIPEKKLELLKGTAAVIARRVGSGSVILFADDPNFRAFWYGTSELFLNAVFFGHSF